MPVTELVLENDRDGVPETDAVSELESVVVWLFDTDPEIVEDGEFDADENPDNDAVGVGELDGVPDGTVLDDIVDVDVRLEEGLGRVVRLTDVDASILGVVDDDTFTAISENVRVAI